MTKKNGLTYKDAGVDIDAGNRLVDAIKPLVKRTMRPGVASSIGGFGGLFSLAETGMEDPVLVSGTDGVGTKLKLAQRLGKHDTIGIDLVAMCVNDIVVQGAEPLFFLDYFATGKLDQAVALDVIRGISEGCVQAGCALIGGETAEMPDMYGDGDYDLAGFAVGAVDRKNLLDGSAIRAGHVLIGLDSSGPHSNGYSLIRKAIDVAGLDLSQPVSDQTLGDALIAPTRIYIKALLDMFSECRIAGLSHITGGGLKENVIRVVPENLGIEIDTTSWQRPAVFDLLQDSVSIAEDEMLKTFNCGIGMVVVVDEQQQQSVIECCQRHQIGARRIGTVTPAGDERVVFSRV